MSLVVAERTPSPRTKQARLRLELVGLRLAPSFELACASKFCTKIQESGEDPLQPSSSLQRSMYKSSAQGRFVRFVRRIEPPSP